MSEPENELSHTIQIPLEYSFKNLLKGKAKRFIRKGIWLMLLAAALLGFAYLLLSITANWQDCISIIFVSYGCLILLNLVIIYVSASIQARQMKLQRLLLQISQGGISVVYNSTGEEKKLTWAQVKCDKNDTEYTFQVPFVPQFIFLEISRLTEGENKMIKKWTGLGAIYTEKSVPDQ